MRDYARILSTLQNTVWLMQPDALQTMLDIVAARINGESVSDEEIFQRIEAARIEQGDRRYETAQVVNGIGILPIYGPIFPKANLMTDFSGATSLEAFRSDFHDMLSDQDVTSIVMDVDSPGGAHDMLPEVADEIFAARGIKPIAAVANTNMHSAAYFLASQADRVYATPSGFLGCIGTYAVHEDVSRKMEMEGRKFTIIKTGENKTEGNPYEPLSDSARAHMQDVVNQCGNEFREAVARGRNITVDQVKEAYGDGRSFKSAAALDRGMIDGIQTLESVVGSLNEGGGGFDVRPAGAFAHSSYDADKEHSEPGTGSPPQPRDPPEEGDKAIAGGWRRDSPPAAFEPPEQEDNAMNREQMVALAGHLGIQVSDEMTDDDLAAAIISETENVVVPLTQARDSAKRSRSLANDYPEEYERLQRLERTDRNHSAHTFAERYQNGLKDEKGEATTKGYSSLVLELIEGAHVAIAERTFTHENLAELLDACAVGVVDYGEQGSSRQQEKNLPRQDDSVRAKRDAFATAVRSKMEQDNLEFDAAMKLVAEEQPELASMYLTAR